MRNYVQFKSGCDINNITTEMLLALYTVSRIYNNYGLNVTVTSGRDGKHMTGSKHYEGNALDFRTYNVPKHIMQLIYSAISFSLSARGYDVVLESDHLHVEFNPKHSPNKH